MIAAAPIVAIASQLAGKPVGVECDRNQSFPIGESGFVWFSADTDGVYHAVATIHLPARVCATLNRLYFTRRAEHPAMWDLASPNGPIVRLTDGNAVHALEHEATHIRLDSGDEARVECSTFRNAWQAVRLFGLAAWKARQVLRGYAIAHFASETTPTNYLAEC